MQSQRPLYARECARVRAGARVYACARCAFLSFSSLFPSSLSLFFLSRSALRVLSSFATHTRVHMHAPASSRSSLASCCSTCAYVRTTDAEKVRIKLSRWFAVCIAWRRRVMRAGVRIYGRRCSQNADRWNVKVLLLFPRDTRTAKSLTSSSSPRDEYGFSYDERGGKIGEHPKIRE